MISRHEVEFSEKHLIAWVGQLQDQVLEAQPTSAIFLASEVNECVQVASQFSGLQLMSEWYIWSVHTAE